MLSRRFVDSAVSVVIPAYDAEEFLRRAVRSVQGQTRPAAEVVIAADDQVDYQRLLRGQGIDCSEIRCVSTGGVGTGAANARNVGLDAAQGRVIATLDADDLLEPRALELLAPLALIHGAAYSTPRIVDYATGEELESLDRPLGSRLVDLEEILTSQIHAYAGVVFDRERVDARWPSWLPRWEDVYFWVKCFDAVDSFYHLAEPLYRYSHRQGSICNRPETGAEFLYWATQLIDRLERGDSLEIQNAAARRLFHRFLKGWQGVETAFLEEVALGQCHDFREFIRRHRDLFETLPPLPPGRRV
jgi:glycosyltransferase involved in cell wall biosynthesis